MAMGNSILVVISLSWLLLSVVSSTSPIEELNNPHKKIDPKVAEICMVAAVKKTCESAYYIAGGDNKGVTPDKVLMKQIQAARLVASWLGGQLGHAKKLSSSEATCNKSLSKMVASTDEAEEGARLHDIQMVRHELGWAMGHVAYCEEAVNGDHHGRADLKYASKVLQEMVDNCITVADNTFVYAS